MPKQSARKIRYSHPARRVFGVLAHKQAYEVAIFLDDLARAAGGAAARDGWTVLPSGTRVAYRVTPDAVVVHNIVPA